MYSVFAVLMLVKTLGWRQTPMNAVSRGVNFRPDLGFGPDHFWAHYWTRSSFNRNLLMCFRLKHFPAQHNDRTSLTPAVISEFKVHETRQRPGRRGFASDPAGGVYNAPPDPSWIRGGKGIRREGNWERKEGKGKGREGGGERGKGGEGGEGETERRGEREGEGPDQVSR